MIIQRIFLNLRDMQTNMFIDTHTHLYDEAFAGEEEIGRAHV